MTQNNTQDVIVIGAGPAGLLACFWLQKLGIPHTLLEKESFPRDKCCADIITSKAIRRLNEVNKELIPEMLSSGILMPIRGTYFSSKAEHSMSLDYKWLDDVEDEYSCYSIEREKLDHFLLQKVEDNPLTTVRTNCEVSSVDITDNECNVKTTKDGTFTSKLIIVGTGSNFNPLFKRNRSGKSSKHFAVGVRAYYKDLEVTENYCHLYAVKDHMPAGFYIAPLADGIANVNMVIRKDVINNKGLDLKKEFERFIESDPVLKDKFDKASRISNFKGSTLALGTKKWPVCGDRYMLTGDAAGLIDLISANGIPQAMLSGKMAALQAQKCLVENNYSRQYIQQYERELFKAIKGDLSLGKILNPLLSYKAINNVLIKSLNFISASTAKNNRLNDLLFHLLYHKRPLMLLVNPRFYYRLARRSKA